jgi:hypothetical protein
MSNYTKATNFATKDSLPTGNPAKIVKGAEINDEYDAIEVAIATKADLISPVFSGDPRAPTPSAADNDTTIPTTAFVKTVISTGGYVKNLGLDDNIVDARALNVADNGTAGQFLISDGDGSFSWQSEASGYIQTPDTTAPTTRDNGDALQEGDIYYNTTDDELNTYDGSEWSSVSGLGSILGKRGTLTTVATNTTSYTATQDGWYLGYGSANTGGTTVLSATVGAPTQIAVSNGVLNLTGSVSETVETGDGGGSVSVTAMFYLYSGETMTTTKGGIGATSYVKRFDPA